MIRKSLIFVTMLAALGATTGAVAAQKPACPDARTCNVYRLSKMRWQVRGGKVTIPYRVNITQPWLLPEDAFAAIDAATRTWEAANPVIDFVFLGRSSDLPQLGNDVSEIAWVSSLPPEALAQSNHRSKGNRRLESDTLLNVAKPWSWTPCDSQSSGCSNEAGVIRFMDVQAVVTQQLGHWLGLEGLTGAHVRELTMSLGVGYGERHKSTLGLGDIKGVRAAYLCRGCRMPRVFTP